MASKTNFISKFKANLSSMLILLVILNTGLFSNASIGMHVSKEVVTSSSNTSRGKHNKLRLNKWNAGIMLFALGYGLGTLNPFKPHPSLIDRGPNPRFEESGFLCKYGFAMTNKSDLSSIIEMNEYWQAFNVSIAMNHDMPVRYREQIQLGRYLPVKSEQLTDERGTIGEGAHGITYLMIDKKTQELTVAKLLKNGFDKSNIESIKHLEREVKFSKKWEEATGYRLNVRYSDNVIYKKFVFGYQLAYWLKSEKIFTNKEVRQKLIEFYENIFSQRKQITDLQYNNLAFDEILKTWTPIDGGDTITFETRQEALSSFLQNYRNKYTHKIRFNGDEDRKQRYFEEIDKLAEEIKNYCLDKWDEPIDLSLPTP